ncbi:MAG: response regulator transcription factor [Prevotellaceae bacterium]|jgi:DNA-binding response OmpR family regulator|nr:response regulator transcription factor [Prevotellaceae bacterium]
MDEKILLVDDDRDICEILSFNLSSEGYKTDCAYSAEEALKKFTPDYSLILLDVMMGGMSGYKMAEHLRRNGHSVPIIFLTAKDTENDMLTGFSVGGDDYISKPFSIKEMVARVKAVLKRTVPVKEQDGRLAFGDIVINMATKEVVAGRRTIALTKTEFEILALLAASPSKIFRREDIIDRVWKDALYTTERTIDVHITRLRKKLGDHASLISSRSGYGYRFNIPE